MELYSNYCQTFQKREDYMLWRGERNKWTKTGSSPRRTGRVGRSIFILLDLKCFHFIFKVTFNILQYIWFFKVCSYNFRQVWGCLGTPDWAQLKISRMHISIPKSRTFIGCFWKHFWLRNLAILLPTKIKKSFYLTLLGLVCFHL